MSTRPSATMHYAPYALEDLSRKCCGARRNTLGLTAVSGIDETYLLWVALAQAGTWPLSTFLVHVVCASPIHAVCGLQTLSEDTRGNGRGGWGEAIREVAHMAAWVMRQVDSSTPGRS
eukprot:scaffold175342_cov22-Tisochrysis_lutea.AAC.1